MLLKLTMLGVSGVEIALDASGTCTVVGVSVVPISPKTVPARSQSMSDPVITGVD